VSVLSPRAPFDPSCHQSHSRFGDEDQDGRCGWVDPARASLYGGKKSGQAGGAGGVGGKADQGAEAGGEAGPRVANDHKVGDAVANDRVRGRTRKGDVKGAHVRVGGARARGEGRGTAAEADVLAHARRVARLAAHYPRGEWNAQAGGGEEAAVPGLHKDVSG